MNNIFRIIPKLKLSRSSSMNSQPCFNFLNGKRAFPSESLGTIENFNPATGELRFPVACSGKEDVDQAVQTAQNAFLKWSKMCPRERGQVLLTAAQLIRKSRDEIACEEVKDTGKPIWEARLDIEGCADVLEYYGGIASTISGSHHQLSSGNFSFVQREPLGVVAGIGAWNYPFQVMTWKAAPALVCGNCFIYKPSEFTPSTAVILAQLFTAAGLPDGVVNIVQGNHQVGEFLCQHPGIAKVSFTGSVETGKKIIKSCADTMKRVTMELGGKSALLVFADCDIVNAVKATLLGNFLTQGEVCSNCTRVFVQKPILDKFLDCLVSATKKLKIGDPFDEGTRVGAVINENHGNKIMNYIQTAQKEGATIACGGERIRLEDQGLNGCFISPCVLTHCEDRMTAVQEEIFGPVVSVLACDTEDEAVTRANASPYGLAAGVMTKDLQRAHRVASALQSGIVWINNYNVFPPEVPFGGYKLSGYGRENGMAALNEYSHLKTVYVEMNNDIDCPLYSE